MPMNERYEPQSIEQRWQKRWDEAGAARAGRRPGAEPRYVLEMFPYPSGAMHMGHARVYTIGDALARFLRMRGYDVLHPIGFDALGLPAENAAIKDGRHPAERTNENILSFRAEMKKLGYAFDWDREIVTADPEYYRWNQWFFLKMLERDIVYRRQGKANWCSGCNTVIANEQVLEKDERRPASGAAPRAGEDHPGVGLPHHPLRAVAARRPRGLKAWPERITTMQRNWIGKSEGAEVRFAVDGLRGVHPGLHHPPGHHLRLHLRRRRARAPARREAHRPDSRAEVDAFVARMKQDRRRRADRGERQKEGVFTGARAVNPFTGENGAGLDGQLRRLPSTAPAR